LKCKVNGCPETTRQGINRFKCWMHGYCPRHAAELVPEIYRKKYDHERMPFHKRTRERSPLVEKALQADAGQEKVPRILRQKEKVRFEKVEEWVE